MIVTSHKDHKANLSKLKTVDEKENTTEWIISVSMLTEGWDVKNVFQIIPWEDRAFNSKLLIAQVLGRGLRIPEVYNSPQPVVIVFNHDSWSKNIKTLVDEILEIETRIISEIIKKGTRAKHHFEVYNLNYEKEKKEINYKNNSVVNYSRIEKEGIKLDSQVIEKYKDTSYQSVMSGELRDRSYLIPEENTQTVEEIIDRIYEEFETRDWEGKILQLGEEQYTQNKLPSKEKIKAIILKSMSNVSIEDDRIIEKNVHKILNGFGTLLRKKTKNPTIQLKVKDPYQIFTEDIAKDSSAIGNFSRDYSLFYTNNWDNEIEDEEQKISLEKLIKNENLPRKAIKDKNNFLFKTPINVVFTNSEPERKFVEELCKKEIAKKIESWLKSRDRGF